MRQSIPMLILLLVGGVALQAQGLTLNEALEMSKRNNPDLRTLRHQRIVTETVLQRTRARYWPTLDARLGYTVQAEPQGIVSRGGVQETQDDRYATAGLSVEQILYDFGRTDGAVEASALRQEISDRSIGQAEQDTALQTIQTFFRILEAEQQLGAASAEETALQDHLRVAQALFDEGMVTRNDLLQAQVRLATSQQQALEWKGRIDNAWLQLDYLIGSSPEFRDTLQIEPDPVPLPALTEVPALLEQRPDLQAARFQVEERRREEKSVRSEFLPQLFARGEATYVENSHVREQTIYALSIGLRCNLFDGFASTASLRRTIEEEAQARDRLQALSRSAELEYRSAWNDVQVAAARIPVYAAAIVQAEENLRINQERYREHVGSATEVLDAQTLLTQTRGAYHHAVFEDRVARARALRALGHL